MHVYVITCTLKIFLMRNRARTAREISVCRYLFSHSTHTAQVLPPLTFRNNLIPGSQSAVIYATSLPGPLSKPSRSSKRIGGPSPSWASLPLSAPSQNPLLSYSLLLTLLPKRKSKLHPPSTMKSIQSLSLSPTQISPLLLNSLYTVSPHRMSQKDSSTRLSDTNG